MTSTVKIPEWWIETTLKDCVSILWDWLHWTPTYDENWEYFFVNWNNLSDWKIIIKGDTKKVSESEYLKYKKDLNNRTIFVSINWTLWNFATYRNEKIILWKSACYFNVLKENDLNYIKYVIINDDFQKYLVREATWTTIKNASLQQLRNYKFILPPLPEQKAIAGVLSSFDDKIELLRAENQTLEEMGQTLFKEWFISPLAPWSGNWTAKNSSDSKKEKSPLGDLGAELPDGWKVGNLGEVVDNYDSKRIPIASDKREIWEYPYYWATGINWYVKDYIFDWIYTLLWEDWSVMKENWKPFTQYVWWKIRVNNHAHVLQWKNWFSTEMIKIILDSVDITPYVTWAVQLKISQWNMNSIPVIIPTDDVLVKFNSLINPIFAKIRANSEEIESLSKTRDQLLPKLMSWEVRVEF